jgi:predicted TPR repeat methyltransferase
MPPTLRLSDDDNAAPSTADVAVMDRAESALNHGRRAEAAALCLKHLAARRLTVFTAGNLVLLLRRAGAPLAGALEEDLIARVRARAAAAPDDPAAQTSLGRLLCGFERFDEAHDVLTRALPRDPLNRPGVMALTVILLKRNRPQDAVALWQPLFAADRAQGGAMLELASILADGGFTDEARRLVDGAEPLFRDNPAAFAPVADAVRGTRTASPQTAVTVDMFDRMAGTYDAHLSSLGNRGPLMVGQVLKQLALPRSRSLAVLDAGCGTGLCAALLRPYARSLHGIDLSPGMLAEARKKKAYHRLGLADITSPGTLPAGPFDLIVSSDVLVYFGDLAPVLANLAAILRPGGWLILTLERTESPSGWLLHPSGRHKHDPDYLKSALQAAGFTAPKTRIDDNIRYELGQPVAAFAVAAQRLALAFGPPPR